MAEEAQYERSPLLPLIDIDSPVMEAACLTDDISFLVRGTEYKSFNVAMEAAGGQMEQVTTKHAPHAFDKAVLILDNRIRSIQKRFERQAILYVSAPGGTNYRYGVALDYKGQRPPKPWWVTDLQKYLIDRWGAIPSSPYLETDDMLADAQTAGTCIVSKDKDLNTVPGWHFNYSKPKEGLYYLSREQALHFFFLQMLAGDGADNIKGLPACTQEMKIRYGLSGQSLRGCGMGSAESILAGLENNPGECLARVVDAYVQVYGDKVVGFMRAAQAALLLHMGTRYE